MVHDMIEVEKMGKPAVPIISGRFEGDAEASARTFAMPSLRFVIVPRIYRNLTPAESLRNTEPAIDDIVRSLTGNGESAATAEAAPEAAVERYEGGDRLDTMMRMNEEFIGRDWGDGFPLLPPTREAIDELLTGTNLPGGPRGVRHAARLRNSNGGEDRGQLGDGRREAGAHAGDHRRGAGALTDGSARRQVAADVDKPSGAAPYRERTRLHPELGINSRSAIGPGLSNRVNITIGRAFLLCLRNIGQWYPDPDGHGHHRHHAQVRPVHRREREG